MLKIVLGRALACWGLKKPFKINGLRAKASEPQHILVCLVPNRSAHSQHVSEDLYLSTFLSPFV